MSKRTAKPAASQVRSMLFYVTYFRPKQGVWGGGYQCGNLVRVNATDEASGRDLALKAIRKADSTVIPQAAEFRGY